MTDMKYIVINIFMLCVCLSSCRQASVFKLEADVHTNEYDSLYIYMIRPDVIFRENDQKLDSALIRNGRFSFECQVNGEPFVVKLALPRKMIILCMVCRNVIVLWRLER